MAVEREQIVQTAEKYVARGKIEPAIKEYRKLLAENPNDINTLNRVGDLYARIQRIDEAVDFFTQIAEQYSAEGFFVKAIAIYKKIIKLDPTRLEFYEQLGELYHKQGLVTEARTQYQVLADYYQKHANAASAIAIYQKMAQLEPDNPTYHVKLAEIYHQQQLIEKAMGEYRIIAELMIKHGRPQEAAQVYERALDIDTQNLPFISDAVTRLREAGNVAGAAHFLSVAVERNPQAERIARMVTVEEPVVEAEPEVPARPAPRVVPPAPPRRPIEIEEESEVDLSLGDDLSRAMAEAAAAVGGEAAAVEAESEEIELELDLGDMFHIELPEEEEEPSSLVKPPPDLAEAPRRPAWAQDAPPDAAAAGADTVTLFREEPQEIEVELELAPLETLEDLGSSPFALRDPTGAFPAPAAPAPPAEDDLVPWGEVADLGAEPTPGPAAPAAAPSAGADLLDQTGAHLAWQESERQEDLVTEAEVLAKYGLEDKALERLGEALRLRPDHLSAYALLIQIHLGHGRHGQVMELANRMSAAAAGRDPWPRVRRRLVREGYGVDGDNVVAVPESGLAAAAPPPAPPAPEPPPILEPPPIAEAPPAPEPVVPSPPVAAAPAKPAKAPSGRAGAPKKADKVDELLRGLLGPGKKPARAPAAPRPPAPAAPVAAAPPAADPSPAAAPAPPAPAASPPPPSAVFNPLQIGELVEALDLDDDGSGISAAAERSFEIPPVPPMPVPRPPVTSGVNHEPLDDTGGMDWLDEPPPQEPTTAAELFAEEDDFFDLAGELVEELSREEVFQRDGMLVQSEQTLEEIVEGFKKGVAEHLSPTDYDTHFNLGIAYKEMGLLDEAIGEFQLASKDPRYLVHCCSMLGLCFLDKGLPDLAIKWYRRALELPGISEEDSMGMMYDLGNVYMAMSDWENAYKTFGDLYGIDANYRDVVAKVEELSRR